MKCPECSENTQVLETRQTRRRRQCLSCGHRFSTVEILSDISPYAETPRAKKAAPEGAVKKPRDKMINVKARVEARRKIEERRDTQRWQKDDWFSSDNDYLPEG
jgi:transcriptional regulator NrdR family protein